jgi:hypothetical protein
MDASRFDDFTRILAKGKPRRDALRVFAGAGVALAAAPVVRADDDHCSHFDGYCDAHTKCCKSLACFSSVCLNCIKAGDTFCQDDKQCCGKATCDSGKCVKGDDAECEGRGCKKKKHKKKKKKH